MYVIASGEMCTKNIFAFLTWAARLVKGTSPDSVSEVWRQARAMLTEPWFNFKMSSYQYRKSHCGVKSILPSSYLYNRISYTYRTTSLYWIGVQVLTDRGLEMHAQWRNCEITIDMIYWNDVNNATIHCHLASYSSQKWPKSYLISYTPFI